MIVGSFAADRLFGLNERCAFALDALQLYSFDTIRRTESAANYCIGGFGHGSVSFTAGLALALDGRLDNGSKVAAMLRVSPRTPPADLVLAGWERWGPSVANDCLAISPLQLSGIPRAKFGFYVMRQANGRCTTASWARRLRLRACLYALRHSKFTDALL